MRWLAALVVLLTATPAFAQDDDDEEETSEEEEVKEEPKEGPFPLLDFMTFGIGFVGQAGATILDKPDDQTVGGVDINQSSEYPGFVGVSTGFGLLLELRFFGYVGVEIDFLAHNDTGSAELEHNDLTNNVSEKFDIEIAQSTLHVPILFKGALPGEWVTPVIFLGPEIVTEGTATCTGKCTGNAANVAYSALPGGYTAFAFGLGLEVNLPIPVVDIRIPLSLRGNVNPGVSSKRDERAEHTVGTMAGQPVITSAAFRTEWAFQATGSFGVAAHF